MEYNEAEWLTITEAAALAGVAWGAIAYQVREGHLRTISVKGRTLVRREDVARYRPGGYKDRRPSRRVGAHH